MNRGRGDCQERGQEKGPRLTAYCHTVKARREYNLRETPINGTYGPDDPVIYQQTRNYKLARFIRDQGTYTLSPPKVLPFSSKSLFSRTAIFLILSLHSSVPLQFDATDQHSEHALDAALTVSSSSSPRECSAVRTSTSRLSPAVHEATPPVGFVVVSETW
jgi:hypothetical protein